MEAQSPGGARGPRSASLDPDGQGSTIRPLAKVNFLRRPEVPGVSDVRFSWGVSPAGQRVVAGVGSRRRVGPGLVGRAPEGGRQGIGRPV